MGILGQALQARIADRLGLLEEPASASPETEAVRALLGRYGTETAGQIGPALMSENPALRQAGLGLLSQLTDPERTAKRELLGAQLAGQRAGQQGQILQNALAAKKLSAFDQEQALGVQSGLLGIRGQQLANARTEMELNARMLEAARPVPALPYGEPPKGSFPAMSPTGQVEYIPQPGSEAFNKAQEQMREAEGLIQDIQRLQAAIAQAGPSGTEQVGPLARTMKFLRGNVTARVLKLRNYGAPQGVELELIDQQLPDPTEFTANALAFAGFMDPTGSAWEYQKEALQAPYQQFRKIAEQNLRALRKTYWYAQKAQGVLPEEPHGAGY